MIVPWWQTSCGKHCGGKISNWYKGDVRKIELSSLADMLNDVKAEKNVPIKRD